MTQPRKYWFPTRQQGWGWGPPSSWQGWLVILAYLGSLLALYRFQPPTDSVVLFLVGVGISTLLLLSICWIKGAPPRKWSDQ